MEDEPTVEPYRSRVDALRYPPGDPRNEWGPGDPDYPWKPDQPIPIVDMRPRGLCATCGFLSMLSIDRSLPGYFEVNDFERAAGQLYKLASGQEARPCCYVDAFALELEANSYTDGTKEERANLVIHGARDCTKWFPYTRFRSPKEHLERHEMLQLERDRREHDLKLAEMQIGVQRDSLKIAEALAETARKADRFTTRWTRAAFTLAAIGVALVAAAYLFPELGRHVGEAIDHALGYPLGRWP